MKHITKGLRLQMISGLTTTLLGLIIFLLSRKFPDLPEGYPGPGLFPSLIGIALFVLGLFVLFRRDAIPSADSDAKKNHLPMALAIGCTALFPVFTRWLDFIFVLPLFIFAMGLLFNLSWLKAIIIATLTSGFIYCIFKFLLGVSL